MDGEKQYSTASQPVSASTNFDREAGAAREFDLSSVEQSTPDHPCPSTLDGSDPALILQCVRHGQVWVINSRRRNGLILYKPFHAEFAGPGAAVGGSYDQDCHVVIPVGNLMLSRPESHNDRQNAYLIRRQWIKLTQQFTDQSSPTQRAQMILNQFETYFDQQTIARVPDEAFAMLVGVLPYSVRMARRPPGKMNVKVKT